MGAPVQTNELSAAAADTTVAVAQGSNPTAGNVNIVWVRGPSAATVTGVADTLGNTYTARGNVTEAGTGQVLYQFTAPITTGGAANTVTATYGASTANRGITVVEASGTYDASNTGTDTGNNPTNAVSATNSAQPATLYMLCNDVLGGTPAVGTGFTNIGTGWATLGLNYRAQYKTVTTVASQSGNFGNAGFDRTNTGLVILLDPSPPAITVQPTDQTANDGATATFTVTETGATSYQWKKNGSNVGTSSNSYALTATFADQSAQITVDCINASGTTTSSTATLRVAFQLSGTGPRSVSLLGGGPMGAGSVESYLRGSAASGGTHTTTGALSADAATLAGTAAHSALHATSGALTSQDAAIAGTAAHLLLHTSTGALSAQAAAVAGTAAHATLHTSTGALTAQDATIAGTAADEHSSTGALTAQAAAIAGTADHRTLHTSTGALAADAAAIAGTAAHENATTGALAAQDATIAGTADHRTLHATTGALSSQAATISGAAQHQHAATGALAAQEAAISGTADHTTAGASHSTSGALAAQDATLAGSAEHLTLHTTSGALTAQASSIAGTAAHQHVATGALAAQDATVDGAAAHLSLHTGTGALAADAATISGAAAHEHTSTGALAAQAATVDGVAVHSAAGTHDATGALAAGEASLSGLAEHIDTGDGLLDPKLIAKKRRQNQNITFKGAGGQAPRKKRDQAPEPVKAKVSPLLLGLMARGLAMPTPAAPVTLEIAPALDVASIAQALLATAIEVPKPEAPLTLEQQLAARVEQLERENAQLQAELTALRTPPEPVQATPRDPIHEALHAILPALADPIDLDAVPDEPEEEPPAAAPQVEQPPKMTPQQIEAENKRRALLLTALLT